MRTSSFFFFFSLLVKLFLKLLLFSLKHLITKSDNDQGFRLASAISGTWFLPNSNRALFTQLGWWNWVRASSVFYIRLRGWILATYGELFLAGFCCCYDMPWGLLYGVYVYEKLKTGRRWKREVWVDFQGLLLFIRVFRRYREMFCVCLKNF